MDTKVTWQEGMTFVGTAPSGFSIRLGADTEVGGTNDGFRPLELMSISLAGCTAMDVISILRKKQQKISAFEVRVHADRSKEHPKIFTHLVVTYVLTGTGIDETALLRAIDLSSTKYCPAQAMLGKITPMVLNYEIYGDDGVLGKSGTFTDPVSA